MKTKLISADEAASILGVGPHAVRHLIRAGRLKAQLVGRQWIIDQNDLKKIQYGRPGPKPVTT